MSMTSLALHSECRLGNISPVLDTERQPRLPSTVRLGSFPHANRQCRGPVALAATDATEQDSRTYINDPWAPSAFMDRLAKVPVPPSRTVFVNDRADDVSLFNPLKRLERLGCGFLAVLMEWEGVIVEDDSDLERKAWCMLAEEEGRTQPAGFLLRRTEGMKNEQVIMEVLCWAREFRRVKALAHRKEELYDSLQGGCYRLRPGSKEFVDMLKRYNIPVAIVSTRPRVYLERAIEAVGMEGMFDYVIAAEDVQRGEPDPEMFQFAAQCLQFIPERCIVVGNSNSSIEAAHDASMKVIAVPGKNRAYELSAADLVVRNLNELSMVDLKNLSDLEMPEFQQPEPQPEPEVERAPTAVALADDS